MLMLIICLTGVVGEGLYVVYRCFVKTVQELRMELYVFIFMLAEYSHVHRREKIFGVANKRVSYSRLGNGGGKW